MEMDKPTGWYTGRRICFYAYVLEMQQLNQKWPVKVEGSIQAA